MATEPTLQEKAAKDFEALLKLKTNDDRRKIEYNKASLTEYLNLTVPEWRDMLKSGRLYDHLQHMLENTENIRRFEIDLLWKRSTYMIGLIFTLFTAFGIVLSYQTDAVTEIPKLYILSALAAINIYFSALLAIMNIESHKSQKHWRYHADYLHELLDTRLMRTFFEKNKQTFTPNEINVAIGILLMFIWGIVFLLLPIMIGDFDGYIVWGRNVLFSIPVVFVMLILIRKITKRLSRTGYDDLHLDPLYFERH